MIVPDAEKLHWRSVSISIKVPRGHLDLDALARAVDPLTGFRVESNHALTAQTYAYVDPLRSIIDLEAHTIQVDSYREEDEDGQEQLQRLDDSGFYSALQSCIRNTRELRVQSTTDLYYPAARTAWRMKMLADTPSLEGFRSEIGTISLSGVKLQFSDSPHGLLEAFLEISPDESEYRCSLTVFNLIPVDQLTTLHGMVLSQAEEFAQLFVEAREEA